MPEPKKQLPREEWDFSICPPHQLPFCLVYEYARACEDSIKQVMEWRRRGIWPEVLAFENANWMQGLPKVRFLEIFTEFPETPWLLINNRARNERIEHCPEYDPPVQAAKVSDLIQNNEHQEMVTSEEPRGKYTTLPMKINWSYPDNRLRQEFGHWIRKHRETIGFQADVRHAPTSHQEYLKKLSALRLLRVYSVEEAIEETKKYLKDPILKKPISLYENNPNVWGRAADEATSYIVSGDMHYCKSPVAREILERFVKWNTHSKIVDRIRDLLFRSSPEQLRELKKMEPKKLRRTLMARIRPEV